MRSRRVAVIGLDGVPPSLLFDAWRKELPNIGALMQQGLWGPLRSCDPPITVPAWASMLSSKDPGELGCYGFRDRRSHAYGDHALVHAATIRQELVPDILSRAGKQVILLGVPPSYPPRPLNGHLVSCFLTPSRATTSTYPASLQAEIERVADGYVFDVSDFRTTDKRALLERIHEKTRKHFRVARHLLTTKPWDFFMMVEMGPDRMHHGFWRYGDPEHPKHEPGNEFQHALRGYYRFLDAQVGELLEWIDDDAVIMVVSDHGAKRMDGGVCINEWLMREGYLRLHRRPEMPTPFAPHLVDWDATTVWAEGGYCGRLFINVQGREPNGCVAAADYERVRRDLIAALATLAGPDGATLGARALRPQELYRDTAGIAPDLLVYFGDLHWRAIGSVGCDDLFASENDTGPDDANHDWDGVCILRDGRTDRAGQRLDGLQIVDVAPTILQHAGVPIPDDMSGCPIDARGIAVDDEAEVRRRLQDLGYI